MSLSAPVRDEMVNLATEAVWEAVQGMRAEVSYAEAQELAVAALTASQVEAGEVEPTRMTVLAWLGALRDEMPPEDVAAVQSFLDRVAQSHGKEQP